MLMAALDFIKNNKTGDREAIRAHISGNYCRCTGYQAIVDAIESVIGK
jgi:carbon-monoxide dehydrogenase small subunit